MRFITMSERVRFMKTMTSYQIIKIFIEIEHAVIIFNRMKH